jgi:sn-glycerol 3-phosphate transport system ATP-binding protein
LEPGEGGLNLAIDLIEPLGSETLVHGHVPDDPTQSLVVKLPGAAPAGDQLAVRLRTEHMHVFDHASGKRIEVIEPESRTARLAAAGVAD